MMGTWRGGIRSHSRLPTSWLEARQAASHPWIFPPSTAAWSMRRNAAIVLGDFELTRRLSGNYKASFLSSTMICRLLGALQTFYYMRQHAVNCVEHCTCHSEAGSINE